MIRRVHCRKIWNDAEKLKRLFLTPIFNKVCVVASLRGTGLLDENIWSEKQCTTGVKKDKTRTTLVLDVYQWHGPGVVCATEPPANLDLSLLDRCCWVVHGSALFRCTHEQLRPETIDERDNRESLTETHMPAPNLDTIRGLLSKVKGPVRLVDLKGKERPYVHSPPPPAQPQQVYEPTEPEQRAAAHAARQHHQATAPTPIVPEDTPTVDETAPGPSVRENFPGTKETAPRQSGPADDPMGTGLSDWLQPFEPEETDADGDPIGTSQEATAEPSANDAKRAMAIRTVNTGRQAEGLPPLKRTRVHLSRGTGESSNDPVESSIPGNDDLYTGCYWSSEVPNEDLGGEQIHEHDCVVSVDRELV